MAALAPPGTKAPGAIEKQSAAPNPSLYIQNLPDKIQKDDLKRELYMLFSTYGPVIDVNALKTPKMRGQAHVLFKDVNTATQALRQCQGSEFFGKEMRISYSKNRSHTVAKLTGTFNAPAAAAEQPDPAAKAPSSFAPPPGAAPPAALPPPPASGLPPPPGLPAKANGDAPGLQVPANEPEDVASPQGTKRQREEESDDEAPMDEDDDDEGGEMDMSDSD